MASKVYECLFLLDSNKYARDQAAIVQGLSDIVEKCGGEMLASRLWMEQKLAYSINGNRKGTYWLTYINLDTQRVGEFNREAQLNNAILRHMLVKLDVRLVDTLVAHARGEELPEEEVEEGAESKDAATTSG